MLKKQTVLLKFMAVALASLKTVVDPYVNMLRNCTQTFSSVVGGVCTYDNPPFDELIRKGDVFSRRIARNLHVMLQEEFGMLSRLMLLAVPGALKP